MAQVSWKQYKGKTVLFQDYRNSDQNEIINIFNKANDMALEADSEKEVLVFANFDVSQVIGEVVQSFKKPKALKAAKRIKKSAIIGKPDLVKQMVNFYTHFTNGVVKDFTNAEEALNWLVED